LSTRDGSGGSPPDFAEFYAAHQHGLVLQLYAYFGDLEQAQDVVQEAFVRALDRWARISGYDDPAAWVRRVAWNLATSQWRWSRLARAFISRQRETPVPGPGPERVALVAALSTLPLTHRRAVIMHYLADLAVSEIALQEGVAEGTVKSWLSRARAALSTRLAVKEV
jgi:RNA polymerase sigma-70 factor, ECF subfamily